MKFNKKADKFLDRLYKSVGAKTYKQKLNLLNLKLGGPSNFSHNMFDAQKVACLEYEILERFGLIRVISV